jgi:stage V sporulation protein S
MAILKVSAHSRPTAVAGAIAGSVRESRRAEVQAIGADAVNQAVKAVAVARGYLEQDNIDVICIPTFVDVEIEGEERTAIKLIVEPRDPNAPFAPTFRSRTQPHPQPVPEA